MSPDDSEVHAAAAATSQVQTLHVGITNCRKLKWTMLGVISKGIMLAQNEAAYEPWITTQMYSCLSSHIQYVFDLTRPSSSIHNYKNTPEKYEFLRLF